MKALGLVSLVDMLFGTAAYSGQPARSAQADARQDRMASVVSTATITGDPDAVFDLITTA